MTLNRLNHAVVVCRTQMRNKHFDRAPKERSIGGYTSVLFVLGMTHRLQDLADGSQDVTGRELAEERLPKRIRWPRNKAPNQQNVSDSTDEQ